uniref:Uncharacterized protein n=1 Tax=Anopheles maculatus TaxID=74869 RepID=A0A182SX65_9DIPT
MLVMGWFVYYTHQQTNAQYERERLEALERQRVARGGYKDVTSGKVCYSEPQELTDIVREALKDRKPLPTSSGEENATPKTKDEEEATKTKEEEEAAKTRSSN